jgi:predicted short-subunit dehydrogenase-like oxidoreductase (DUF2520 family)
MKTINIIGCGRVGKTLGRLWHINNCFKIQSILNRSITSSNIAASFIGAGNAIQSYSEMGEADYIMISACDQSISDCAISLSQTTCVKEGTIVFHCSGSLPSTILDILRDKGAFIASIHPVKSFADPAIAVDSFAGTYCGIEGDKTACNFLSDLFTKCGAYVFNITKEYKMLYHAGTVIVCNYLVALIEAGLLCYEKAGISRDDALKIIAPIMQGTIANVMQLGTTKALTGPIARGEERIIEEQCQSLSLLNPKIAQIYKALGIITVDLSKAQGIASESSLVRMVKMFEELENRRSL